MVLTSTSRARHQRGAATLIVVMVLFFVISLVAAYTSRNLIFEQRTSNNQLRATQALETAEAGIEWALSMLNHGRIVGGTCATSTSTADTTFRQRFLTVDSAGYILPAPGGLTAVCVYNGTDWTCSCTGTGSVTAPNTTDNWPAFRVRFLKTFDVVSTAVLPKQPSVIRVQVVGCTRLDNGCLSFTGPGLFNEGRAMIYSNLALFGGPSSAPQVALMARGAVSVTGTGFAAYNTMAAGSGVTVQSGGAVNGYTTLATAPGSPGGPTTMIQNDSALNGLVSLLGPPPYSVQDRMFSAVFNMRPDAFRDQQAIIDLPCGGTCSIADVRNAAALNPWRPIWVDGDLLVDSTGDVGTAAEPALILVNGNVSSTVSGVNIFGMVYSRAANWDPNAGPALRITGAAVAEGTLSGAGDLTFVHDTDVMRLLRWNTGSFVRIPGSWKDYQE